MPIQTAYDSLTNISGSPFGFKNRIINGAMVIDQRNNGASVTPANNGYTLDRWQVVALQASKFTIQRNAGSVTPPVGFSNYLGVTSSSAYSVLTGDTFAVMQPIEGFNAADLAWGTASAIPITISFWVRSSLTGVFGGSLWSGARGYVFTYSINAANTWEYKTVTIAGDTSGTYNNDNSLFTQVRFGLGSGSTFLGTAGSWSTSNLVQPTGAVSVVGTNGATFYITGVQLEKGSTATPFDYRSYGTELQLCQRYCYRVQNTNGGNGNNMGAGQVVNAFTATRAFGTFSVSVPMRSSPTMTFSGLIAYTAGFASSITITSLSVYQSPNIESREFYMELNAASGLTGFMTPYLSGAATSFVQFSSEFS